MPKHQSLLAGGMTMDTKEDSMPFLKDERICRVKCKELTAIQASCMPS
jgi:hypothetical protein